MKKLSGLIILAGLFLSVSCVIAVVDPRHPERPTISLSQFYRSLPLKPGGSIFLNNTAGNITIDGWDDENVEVLVDESMGLPPSARFYFLGWRRPKPNIQIESGGEEIRIQTPRSGKEQDYRLFSYRLQVPRSVNLQEILNGQGDIEISDIFGNLRIRGKEGTIRVRNFSGPLDITLGSGDVEAELLDLRPEDEVRVTVEDGDITLYLEPGVGAELEARIPEGTISSEFDLPQANQAGMVAAKLGDGGTRISLIVKRGDVKILRVED
jgi:hypothetical protein